VGYGAKVLASELSPPMVTPEGVMARPPMPEAPTPRPLIPGPEKPQPMTMQGNPEGSMPIEATTQVPETMPNGTVPKGSIPETAPKAPALEPDVGLSNRGYRPEPGERSMTREQWKAQSGASRAKHDSLLRGALGRQGFREGDPYPHGLKEKWTVNEHGHTYEVRVHPADPNHGKTGDIYRVARRQNGVDANGQGYGWEYADSQGNWHHTKTLKPGKGGAVNPDFDPQAAADTHIPMPTGNIK
jgi:hypothetical protein